ncbi:TPA: transposase domain-containing protein, partial [Burkholderia cepacia]|nr:transposase domain-containing protein [Burkholderia cepacia]
KHFHNRKGWLFSDTVADAQASANLYSLVETCKANGVEPYRYLVWLFTRLPLATTTDDYAALIPWSMPAALNRWGVVKEPHTMRRR